MKSAIVFSLIASAAAFAPASTTSKASTALAAKTPSVFANEIGAQAPLGFWDPMGVCSDGDKEEFDRLRYVELKHGRVAMLAVVGYLTTAAGIRFPGAEDIPGGFAAVAAIPNMVLLQMLMTWTLMEMANRDVTGENEFAGDFRNGALDFGWDKQTDDWKRKKRSIELNQGRAAQMGIFGLMVHDIAFGDVTAILPLAAH